MKIRIFVPLMVAIGAMSSACSTDPVQASRVLVVDRVLVWDIAVQDLTGSGVASLLDWVRARPDVLERAGLVEFDIGVGDIEDEVTPGLSPVHQCETYFLVMPWESCPRPEIREEPDGVERIPCRERDTRPCRLVKQKAIAALGKLTIEIDGKAVDLARTAVLHWKLCSLCLLPVGRHEIRVVWDGKSAVKVFNIPARQARIHAKDIVTKNISSGICFDVAFKDPIITVFDWSDEPFNDSPFSLLPPPRM